MHKDFARNCDLIEECYEYLLAYAAMGVSGEAEGGKAGQVRHFLDRAADALTGISEMCADVVSEAAESAQQYKPFLAVLDRDARDSHAAIELVRAQPMISSQLIDNLNASIHLRALLTDLFLIDEVRKLQSASEAATSENAAGS